MHMPIKSVKALIRDQKDITIGACNLRRLSEWGNFDLVLGDPSYFFSNDPKNRWHEILSKASPILDTIEIEIYLNNEGRKDFKYNNRKNGWWVTAHVDGENLCIFIQREPKTEEADTSHRLDIPPIIDQILAALPA